jgi:hypothetical protein
MGGLVGTHRLVSESTSRVSELPFFLWFKLIDKELRPESLQPNLEARYATHLIGLDLKNCRPNPNSEKARVY